jgi:hypothetical protein
MPTEPDIKHAIAFIDGQNLYHNVRKAFGDTFPNYDVEKLAQAVCDTQVGATVPGLSSASRATDTDRRRLGIDELTQRVGIFDLLQMVAQRSHLIEHG